MSKQWVHLFTLGLVCRSVITVDYGMQYFVIVYIAQYLALYSE